MTKPLIQIDDLIREMTDDEISELDKLQASVKELGETPEA